MFRSFLTEQTDPDGFYSLIADDAVALVAQHVDLAGATVADFGGGPGFYSAAFREAGATTVLIDADIDEIRLHGRRTPGSVVGVAEQAPLADGAVDVAFSSNLLEHVRDPELAADEMARVARPGGVLVLSYTNGLSPWGGHETSPFHWLGGQRAVRRYERRHGRPPKNIVDRNLFRISVAQMVRWARSRDDAEIVLLRPRYLPPALGWIVRVPLLRELVTWNLLLVLRKR